MLVIGRKEGTPQYLSIDFRDRNRTTLTIAHPSDELTVKAIRAFAEDGVREFLEAKREPPDATPAKP